MATSNFHNVNSSQIFAKELIDEFDYDDFKDNVKYSISNNFKSYDEIDDYNDPTGLRSFPSIRLCSIDSNVCVGDIEATITIYTVIRSGYYEGVNLDYYIEYNIEGYTYDDIDEGELIDIYGNDNITSDEISNFLHEVKLKKDEMVEEVEKIYAEHTVVLKVVARFSNGETIYEKA
jgi:hypothetical protein